MSEMVVHTSGGRRINFPVRVGRRLILLKVNTVCNLKCDYCWYVINPILNVPVRDESTEAHMKEMIREIGPRTGDVFYLSGGEAILRNDIKKISQSIRKSGARVYLTTNGMLLNRLLSLAPEIHGYVVSLDSIDQAMHDSHRGGHRTTIKNIPYLVEKRPVCVTVTIYRENLRQLGQIANACVKWGVQSLFYQLLWFPNGTIERSRRCLQPSDCETLSNELDTLENTHASLQLPSPSYRALLEATVEEGGASGKVINCFAMNGYLTTDPRGDVLPCQPHGFINGQNKPGDTPWSNGVCHYLSEECTCLMGHFHSDLIDDTN